MKKIKFIYATMLLVLALAMNACDDYYSVTVNGDPGITPTVLITPEESITLPAKEAAGEIEIISNMDNSTISFHVPSDAERWCSVTLEGNRISLALEDTPDRFPQLLIYHPSPYKSCLYQNSRQKEF